jgi:histone deacetylase 6
LDWFQGTPKLFQDDQRVLFVSFRHAETPQGEDSAGFIGLDPARGFTINLALPEQNLGPTECLTALYRVLLPIFYQFGPELVLVAAGRGIHQVHGNL